MAIWQRVLLSRCPRLRGLNTSCYLIDSLWSRHPDGRPGSSGPPSCSILPPLLSRLLRPHLRRRPGRSRSCQSLCPFIVTEKLKRPSSALGASPEAALSACRMRAPGHHGYQRACVLISGQASSGPFGSPVCAHAGKTGPPSRLILSQTLRQATGIGDYVIAVSLSLQFLPPSRPAHPGALRAGAVKALFAATRRGMALTAPSMMPHSSKSGWHRACSHTFEVALLVENGPGNARELAIAGSGVLARRFQVAAQELSI